MKLPYHQPPIPMLQLPVIDCIFTRVGAGDIAVRGISTFMSEMLDVGRCVWLPFLIMLLPTATAKPFCGVPAVSWPLRHLTPWSLSTNWEGVRSSEGVCTLLASCVCDLSTLNAPFDQRTHCRQQPLFFIPSFHPLFCTPSVLPVPLYPYLPVPFAYNPFSVFLPSYRYFDV